MISVSESAMGQLKGLIPEQPETKVGLRVFIQSGGCSGFSYGMGLDENPPREDDEVVDCGGRVLMPGRPVVRRLVIVVRS